jgi:hypothetical protein
VPQVFRALEKCSLKPRELTMTPGKWEQVQKMFETVLPERFRKRVSAVQRPRAGEGQSET